MRAYDGPAATLAMVEQFTLAVARLPYARERASVLLSRAAFAERTAALRRTLDTSLEAAAAVRRDRGLTYDLGEADL